MSKFKFKARVYEDPNKISFKDYKVQTEPSVHKKLDETLDVGRFTIPALRKSNPLQQLSLVELFSEKNGNSNKIGDYIIDFDRAELVSKSPAIYSHKVSLAELTHLLDKKTCPTLTFTQPTDGTVRYSMLDVLVRIAKVHELRLESEQHDYFFFIEGLGYAKDGNFLKPVEFLPDNYLTRYEVEEGSFADKMQKIVAPQLFINQPTLRECINQALKFVFATTRLKFDEPFFPEGFSSDNKKRFILGADFFNELVKKISPEKYNRRIQEIQTQNANLYTHKIETSLENAISEGVSSVASVFFPSRYGWATARSDEVVMDSKDSKIILPHNIQELIEVEMLFSHNGISYLYDMTDWVKEFEDWNRQDGELSLSEGITNKVRNNTMYFKRYNNTIEHVGNFSKVSAFSSDTTLHRALKGELTSNAINVSAGVLVNTRDVLWRLRYIPAIDSRIQVYRNDSELFPYDTTMFINQRDKVVSLENLINNMYGKVERMGLPDLEITQVVKDIAQANNIGDFTEDNFIVTEREEIYANDSILIKYKLNKNWNRLNEFIGVENEARSTEIPVTGRTLVSNRIYNEFVEFKAILGTDIVPGFNIDNQCKILQDEGVDLFLDTMSATKVQKSADIGFYKNDNGATSAFDYLRFPMTNNGSGNTISFNFKFDSTVTAGDQIKIKSGAYSNNAVNYTDTLSGDVFDTPLGTVDKFSIASYDRVVDWSSTPIDLDYIRRFPYYDNILGNQPDQIYSERELYLDNQSDMFVALKDPSETLALNYQLNMYTTSNYISKERQFKAEDSIIGKMLSERNKLVKMSEQSNLFLFFSEERYGKNENTVVKDHFLVFDFGKADTNTGKLHGSMIGNYISLFGDTGFDVQDYNSWAIGDSEGNLYYAQNKDKDTGFIPEVIAIEFKNKKTGIVK